MLEKFNRSDFDNVYRLMCESFPTDEYRPYAEQLRLTDFSEYSLFGLHGENGTVKAFISVWDFNTFAYIEHFAVATSCRNGGVGANILERVQDKIKKLIVLEVERPETEIARRRINFYERNGFFLNEYDYVQPPISQGKNPLPLFIMSSKGKISEKRFAEIKEKIYSAVYGVVANVDFN